MAIFGYARVSTLDQDPASQMSRLRALGAGEVVEERLSGDVLGLVEHLRMQGVVLLSADIGLDTSTDVGGLVLGILALVAGWERRRLQERVREGRAVARAEGRSLGRRFALTAGQRREAIRMAADGRSVSDVARALACSRSTAHRAMLRGVM